eukprot:3575362-Pleurochrysis_carterae.AAC.1
MTPVQACGPPPPLILATQPSLSSSCALRHTAICHTPHRSVCSSLRSSGSARHGSCRHAAGNVSLYPLMKSATSAPPGVTSMSHSAPVVGVVPRMRVKWAKMSPSAGRPRSDASMILTSSASFGVSAVERDVERVCTLSRLAPIGVCSPHPSACPPVVSLSFLCSLTPSPLSSSARCSLQPPPSPLFLSRSLGL